MYKWFFVLLLCLAMSVPVFAGTPHTVLGSVNNDDGSTPANGTVTFRAYITTRSGEVLTQSSSGCGYTSGAYMVNTGNFATPWTAGEKLRVDATNTSTGKTVSVTVTLNTSDPQSGPTITFPVPKPNITLSPSSKDFGDVLIGASSTQTIVVGNNGDGTLDVSNVSIQGSGDFSVTGGGGSFSLNPGATRNVQVTLAPSQAGSLTAKLVVASNDNDEPSKEANLSGQGVTPTPDINLNPSGLNFGDVAVNSSKTITLKVENKGSADLVISSISFSGDNEFEIVSGGSGTTLSPGGSHNVQVQFSPGSSGSYSGAINISSNDPDEGSVIANVSGRGYVPTPDIDITPTSKDFGAVGLGLSATQEFTIKNRGTAQLNVTGVELHGNETSQYSLEGSTSFSLNAGQSRNVTVTFSPSEVGSHAVTLRVQSNDPNEGVVETPVSGTGVGIPDIEVAPLELDFGDLTVGQSVALDVMVYNYGIDALIVQQCRLENNDGGDFQVVQNASSFSVPPNDSAVVKVRFAPFSDGDKQADLKILSNDPDESVVTVVLNAVCTSPDIYSDTNRMVYANTNVGEQAEAVAAIENRGQRVLNISQVRLSGQDAQDFELGEGAEAVDVEPGELENMAVKFMPQSAGMKKAMLEIRSNDADTPVFTIELNGRGIMTDTRAPELDQCYPGEGASAIVTNTAIQFDLVDPPNLFGVNLASLNIHINGTAVVSGGADQQGGTLFIQERHTKTRVFYQPAEEFTAGSNVVVHVQCEDRNDPPNSMDSSYTFQIGEAVLTPTATVEVRPGGGTVSCHETGVELNLPVDALGDTTDISVGTVDMVPPLPTGVKGVGLAYRFGPPGIKFQKDVTIRIPYTEAMLQEAGVTDPMDLPLYYYLTSKGQWVKLDIVLVFGEYVYVNVREFCYLTTSQILTDVDEEAIFPRSVKLHPNYPNPFNPSTSIAFELPSPAQVELAVYDDRGCLVRQLTAGLQPAGRQKLQWDGRDGDGRSVASGLYIARLQVGNEVKTQKLILMK